MPEKPYMSISNKQCSRCFLNKRSEEFSKNKTKSDGLQVWCKSCRKEHDALYYSSNQPRLSKVRALYKRNNIEKTRISSADYYNRNKESIAEKQRAYNVEHKDVVRATRRRSEHKRLNSNIDFKLRKRLRIRLHSALKNEQKKGSAVSDLGCSIQHLKLHLELFWDEGMTWANYGFGKDKWNIDHIKPLASFDLTDRSQLLQAVHYTNLQPLWHVDNLAKSDTVIVN